MKWVNVLSDTLCLFKVSNKVTRMKSVGVILVSSWVTLTLKALMLFFDVYFGTCTLRKAKVNLKPAFKRNGSQGCSNFSNFFSWSLEVNWIIFYFVSVESFQRHIFRTLSNIYDETFLRKWLTTHHSGQHYISMAFWSVIFFRFSSETQEPTVSISKTRLA